MQSQPRPSRRRPKPSHQLLLQVERVRSFLLHFSSFRSNKRSSEDARKRRLRPRPRRGLDLRRKSEERPKRRRSARRPRL